MTLLEDRILRIIELRRSGLDNNAIAQELKIDSSLVVGYETETRRALEVAISFGAYTPEMMMKYIPFGIITLSLLLSEYKIDIPESTSNQPRAPSSATRKPQIAYIKKSRIAAIQAAVAKGDFSVEKMADQLGLTPSTVLSYVSRLGIKFPKGSLRQLAIAAGRAYDQKMDAVGQDAPVISKAPIRDRLIAEGMSLGKIATEVGITRQAVDDYIIRTGQYDVWRAKRAQAKETRVTEQLTHRRFMQRLVDVLQTRLEERVSQFSWAEQKAFEYILSKQRTTYSVEMLTTIFSRYQDATNAGQQLSLEQLGKGFSLYLASVGRILADTGLPPMYGKRQRIVTSEEKKEAIQRGFSTELPSPDIAYFLNIQGHVVAWKYWHTGKRPWAKKRIMQLKHRGAFLNYRLASQIYEAQDAGFSHDETCQLLGTQGGFVSYAMQHRETIEKKIVDALRILHPSRNSINPYL